MNRRSKHIAMQQPTVLLAATESTERMRLQSILQEANSRVLICSRGRDAMELVEFASVVICEDPLPDCSWRDILLRAQSGDQPPPVIVTSRQCSSSLWSEALNLGVHDILAQPFCADETMRVVRSAHRRFTLPGTPEFSNESAEPCGPVASTTHIR